MRRVEERTMPAYPLAFRARLPWKWSRAFSTRSLERVDVRCGSGGDVSIDLFNDPKNSTRPIVVHLPPFPSVDGSPAKIPGFLRDLPIASINYRWSKVKQAVDRHGTLLPLHWPTPIHDTAIAFTWLMKNMAPPEKAPKRDVIVHGSHLGATLAASLSLTESYARNQYFIRGFIGYNGIYDWTMFLPDHPLNSGTMATMLSRRREPPLESRLDKLRKSMPGLFVDPSDLFDAFASPSLFFYSPGLHIPSSFTLTMEESARLKAKRNLKKIKARRDSTREKAVITFEDSIRMNVRRSDEDITVVLPKKPRKTFLKFPPPSTTLKVPQTLLLHDEPWKATGIAETKTAKPSAHTFAVQAEQMVDLMRRSISELELGRRVTENADNVDKEAQSRVKVSEVGPETSSVEMSESGQRLARQWLWEWI